MLYGEGMLYIIIGGIAGGLIRLVWDVIVEGGMPQDKRF